MRKPNTIGRHFYIVLALFVACTVIYYFGELVNLFGWEILRWNVWYTVHDPHRILFLVPILYCSYYYGLRGALLSNVVALLIFLPRALFISPYPDATLRMIIFVIASTALSTLLALLLTNRSKNIEFHDRSRPAMEKYPKIPRLLLLIFIFMSAGILISGYVFYSDYQKNYRSQIEHHLSSIADLKIGEIVQWRKERIGDANMLFRNSAFSGLVQLYLEHPDDAESQERVRSWLSHYLQIGQYEKIMLLDAQGAERIVIPDTSELIDRHITQDAARALQSGKLTVLDLERDKDIPSPHMVILTPIYRESDDSVPLAVAALVIDPYRYLYPLIGRWPTSSATAETLIVRRDGNDALYLNELKFEKDSALNLRIPLEQKDVPAVRAILGEEGIVEGSDYRGQRVIADIRNIPDSPWFMVARIDIAEVYAPLTQMLWLTIILVGALLIGAGSGVGLVWRLQSIRVYQERAEIADALKVSEERHRLIIDHSLDMIYTLDVEGRLLFVSPASQRILGYDPSEMQGQLIRSFIHPDDQPVVENALKDFIETGNFTPGLEYRTKQASGDWRWHTTRGNSVLDENGSFLYFVGIAHDITERRQAVIALQESEQLYRSLFENMLNGFAYCRMLFELGQPRDFIYLAVNAAFEKQTGLKDVAGKKVSEVIPGIYEADPHIFEVYGRVASTGIPEYLETYVSALGMWFSISVYSPQKEYFVAVFDVITERKLAEEKLVKSYESLKKALDDSINTMVKIVELRDPYTSGHQQRVADLAISIAREMKLEDTRIDNLRTAAVIHDIGKMYVPSDILSKPGRLSDIEFNLIKTHAQSGYDIVKGMDLPVVVAQAILQHHERLDGSGYPVGLKSEDTLLEAKILAVADVIDAMAADRPYRAALGSDKALEEISRNRGRLYDPVVVDTCLEIFKSGRFQFKPV